MMAVRHGHRPAGDMSPTYRSWVSLRQRCNNPNATGYENYGGRGVGVCKRWDEYENFLKDMGERPHGSSIDRIDVNGDYSPDNCKWSCAEDQARNRRSSVDVDGASVHELADKYGISAGKIRRRISEGKTIEDIVSSESLLTRRHGDNCPAAKLTRSEVVEIKERLSKGETCASLARAFGRSYMCIKDIEKGKNWNRVPWPC